MAQPDISPDTYRSMDMIHRRNDGHIETFKGDVDGQGVIIKIAVERDAVADLTKEAKILEQLADSPHAANLYQIGRNEHTRKTYVAMEELKGSGLPDFLKLDDWRGTPLEPEVANDLLERIAAAEQNFLDRGVLYRDLNPEHIIIGDDGLAKFVDFGAALNEPREVNGKSVWQTSDVFGTWETMAPEEFAPGSKELDETLIVYQLGIIYHMLLTGELPIPRFNDHNEVTRWAKNPTFQLSDKLDENGRELFGKILTKDPKDRFQTIEEMLDAAQIHMKGVQRTPPQ